MQNNNFIDLLSNSIYGGKSLSLTRLGDGEMFILNNNAPKYLKIRAEKEWGVPFSELVSIVRPTLLYAIRNSDVIGLLDDSGYMKHAWTADWVLQDNVLQEAKRTKKIMICDHQITRGPILGDVTKLKEILANKAIHIISSRTTGLKENRLSEKLNCNITYTQVDYYETILYRQRLLASIAEISEQIVIISAGVMGKDIPSILAKSGKICLDFGATVDAWAGISSRPTLVVGGLQSHCLITREK